MTKWTRYAIVIALLGGVGLPNAGGGTFQILQKTAITIGNRIGGEAAETGGTKTGKVLRKAPGEGSQNSVLRETGSEVAARGANAADDFGETGRMIVNRLGKEGATLLNRNGEAVVPLVREYGAEAAEVCVKHPGLGRRLVEEFGERGIRVGQTLETDEVIRLYRAMKRMPPGKSRMMLLKRAGRQGGRAIRFAERHPKTVLGGATIGYLLTHPQQVGELASKSILGVLKGVGIDPESSPVAAIAVVGLFAFILMGPVYLYGYLRYRR